MKSHTQTEAHCQNCECSGRASFVDRWMLMTILNAIWFIGWFALIYKMDLSMWWILLPVFLHWRASDFGMETYYEKDTDS